MLEDASDASVPLYKYGSILHTVPPYFPMYALCTGWSNWVGRIHIMCSGPLRDHYGTPGAPKRARFGPERPLWEPRRALGSPGGPNLGPSATGWSNWVGCIHIMCSGPLRDLYSTPGAPKRARFGPERPLWEPRRALGSPGGPDLGPTATGWSNWVGHMAMMLNERQFYSTPPNILSGGILVG